MVGEKLLQVGAVVEDVAGGQPHEGGSAPNAPPVGEGLLRDPVLGGHARTGGVYLLRHSVGPCFTLPRFTSY